MKLPLALWTSGVIQDLVWYLWHVRIARRTVSTYLKRWGFTPQKPAKRLSFSMISAITNQGTVRFMTYHILDEIQAVLLEHNLLLKQGSVVDVTLIDALRTK